MSRYEPDEDGDVTSSTFVPREVRRRRITSALLTIDTAAILAAVYVAGVAEAQGVAGYTSAADAAVSYAMVAAVLTVVGLLLMFRANLYHTENRGWGSAEFTRTARAIALAVIFTVAGMFLLGLPIPSREWVVVVGICGIVFVALGRAFARYVEVRMLRRGGWLQRPTLIVGSNIEAAEVARLLQSAPESGLLPVGCLRSSQKDQLSFNYHPPSIKMLGTARDLVWSLDQHRIDTVIIVASAFDAEVVKRMISELRGVPVTVHLSSALSEVLPSRVWMDEVAGIPLISLKAVSLSPAKLRTKRAFDIAVSSAVILIGLPLWLTLAALIKLTSRGPVFYKQERVGRGGERFMMYKFRSMVADADARLVELSKQNEADGPLFKMRNDPRVTPVGRWMRKFSLDEFPQLINVLKGEMSLVGPRPPLPHETVSYEPGDWHRLGVPPGMTGLWQVSGRSSLAFRDMVRLDIFYIDNWSLSLDISLLVRTLPAVIFARGAY